MDKYIYGLFDGDLCLYVGQTKHLNQRKASHARKKDMIGTSEIPEHNIWEMRVLECCARGEHMFRETYYYDTLKPLYNKKRPGKTKEEWIEEERKIKECRDRQKLKLDLIHSFLQDISINIVFEKYASLFYDTEDDTDDVAPVCRH
jgi:hypothetical protein